MSSWLVWGVFAIAAVLLGWIGYHFTVRTLRFVTAGFALAVAMLVTRYGVTHPAGAPADVVNAFTHGMDKLCTAFLQPLLGGQLLAHSRVVWLVIIAVLVFAYRELEVWAMHWQPPAVDMSALGRNRPGRALVGPGDDGPDLQREHDQLVAELRFRLPAVEVRTPSVVPGAATANGLASVAENSDTAVSGLAGAVIRLAGMLWPNPRRYQVRIWVEAVDLQGAANGLEKARKVTVDLEDPQTGRSIATKTLVADDLDQAAEVVAGYVARQIFKADPTTPAWSVGSFDGGDLAALLSVQQLHVSRECGKNDSCVRRRKIGILKKEVCNSYSAGVARHELALLQDLEGDHMAALSLYAINREQYPRFYRSRYRLGMSLEMIANPAFPIDGEAEGMLEEILGRLDRCGVTDNAACKCEIVGERSAELLKAAKNELRACRRQLMLWRIVWATFWHRDERAIRMPHWRMRERQRFHDGARVAELLVTVRQSLNGERCRFRDRMLARRAIRITTAITGDGTTIRKVLKNSPLLCMDVPPPGKNSTKTRWLPWQCRTPSWQAAYNTACLYAALEDRGTGPRGSMAERVVASLRRVVDDRDCDMERPSDWISKDPDFSFLKASSGIFNDFLNAQRQIDYPTDKLNRISTHV
jgi:hypothetical protein